MSPKVFWKALFKKVQSAPAGWGSAPHFCLTHAVTDGRDYVVLSQPGFVCQIFQSTSCRDEYTVICFFVINCVNSTRCHCWFSWVSFHFHLLVLLWIEAVLCNLRLLLSVAGQIIELVYAAGVLYSCCSLAHHGFHMPWSFKESIIIT